MQRLFIIVLISCSTPVAAGSYFSRPASQAIQVKAILYTVGNKTVLLSQDRDQYRRTQEGDYYRYAMPASAQASATPNRIIIANVDFDSKAELAKITYYVRIGHGNTPQKGYAEVNFGSSNIQPWDSDTSVKVLTSYISGGIELSDN